MMPDRYHRRIDYLRISLTDNCNLRCVYCMPLRGLSFAPHEELLTAAEIERVVRAAVSVGFRKFRLTGGEPTLRVDLLEIVTRLNAIEGVEDLAMTTNGVLLPTMADALRDAGLHRVNVHIDTLDPERLQRVMRFGSKDALWAGIEAAQSAGFSPIKLNVVVARDYNEGDVVELARLTVDRPWHVRFIELMPLGAGPCASLSLAKYVPNPETRQRIEAALGVLTPLPAANSSDESCNHVLPGAHGVVGFISPVSEPYCGNCNRMRLTADGRFHLCLLHDEELDVKSALRSGAGKEEIVAVLRHAVDAKPIGHRLDEGISSRVRSMFQLGG